MVDNPGERPGGVRRVIADIVELAELQARLFASDAKCLAVSTRRPLMLGSISFVLLLGALPVLLFALADFVVQRFNWTLASAQMIVAGATILVAALFCAAATKGLRACGPPLRSSLAEFEKNMDTLREIVAGASVVQNHLGQMDRSEGRN